MSCVAETENRGCGGLDAVGIEDAFLERLEVGGTGGFGCVVARDGDVDDTTGRDVAGEKDGGKFDLGRVS